MLREGLERHTFLVLRAVLCAEPPGLSLTRGLPLPEYHIVSDALVLFSRLLPTAKKRYIWFAESISDDSICVFSRAAVKCIVGLIALVFQCSC